MVIVWNVITVIKTHRPGRGNSAGDPCCVPNLPIISEEQQWGVRGQLWPEVTGKFSSSRRLCLLVSLCAWVHSLVAHPTSGTSERVGGWCLGHQSGSSAALFGCPQSCSLSPLSPCLLLRCQIPSHTCSVSLVSCRQMGSHMEPFCETGKVCERLCCMAVFPG